MRLLSLLVLFCFASNNVFANCYCSEVVTADAAWNESTAIFSGEVVDIIPIDIYGYIVEIEVYEVWKDRILDKGNIRYVYSSSGDGGCGLNLLLGESYLFYVTLYQNSMLIASKCSPSKLLRYAQDDVQALNLLRDNPPKSGRK
ncbi:hypothetical protein RLOatenuis_2610 [Rickettsiales bacterium]|nr:hypothetical protein RLOatenuis_2610 [Rickettsiales bacterium]